MKIITDTDTDMEPNFNPYENEEVDQITRSLDQLRYDIQSWMESDRNSLVNPLDLGPTSLKFLEARLDLLQLAFDQLDNATANIRASVKVTELLGEWRNWWSAQ